MSVIQHPSTTGNTGNSYFNNYTTTNAYVELSFGFSASKVSLVNDSNGADDAQISWDGSTQIYDLKAGEYKDLIAYGKSSIYIKATTGGEKVRVTAE